MLGTSSRYVLYESQWFLGLGLSRTQPEVEGVIVPDCGDVHCC